MSKITGSEPKHWHGTDDKHRMPDLRRLDGYQERFWNPDERAYVAHLREHESLDTTPKPRPDDNDAVRTLFESIKLAERTSHNAKELIIALRRANKGTVDQVKNEEV